MKENVLVVQLEDTGANIEALGAKVRLTVSGRTQVRTVNGAAGYLGHNDARHYFGLGAASRVERVEVVWPGGDIEQIVDLPVNRVLLVRRQRGHVMRNLGEMGEEKAD